MTPAAIIEKAAAEGVRLTISPSGTIKATGDQSAVSRWLPIIRESKPAIIAMLLEPAKDATSWGWLLHYPDREPVEVYSLPESTHAEMLRDFPGAIAAEPLKPSFRQPTRPMTADEETAIREWLATIEETDPYIIADVLERCRRDADARDYFTKPASAGLPMPAPFPDDRRTCDECANLIARRCQAAKRGEIVASQSYELIRDLPRRCEGYAPGAADVDRRPGRERWPGLTDTKGTK